VCASPLLTGPRRDVFLTSPPQPQVPTTSEVMHLVMVFSADGWHPDDLPGAPREAWRPFHHALAR
jgi:hypothetical protein